MQKLCDINTVLVEAESPFAWSETGPALYKGAVHLIGFGFDGTACFRKGTRLGPDALRAVSGDIESYSPYLDLDLRDMRYFDLGNLDTGFVPGSEEAETEEGHKAVEAGWQRATDDFFARAASNVCEYHQTAGLADEPAAGTAETNGFTYNPANGNVLSFLNKPN